MNENEPELVSEYLNQKGSSDCEKCNKMLKQAYYDSLLGNDININYCEKCSKKHMELLKRYVNESK